jgi:hypothetical protein
MSITQMERVHQLLAAGTITKARDDFWQYNWHHIASAKVPLETKVAAYKALNLRGVVDINNMFNTEDLYVMLLADQAFVAALDLDAHASYCYRVYMALTNDDVATLAKLEQELPENGPFAESSYCLRYEIWYLLATLNASRCMRFSLQDRTFREAIMEQPLSPLEQRLVEELVQPTDRLNRRWLLVSSQSVKLIGMCVKDEELVEEWLKRFWSYAILSSRYMSVMFAHKLHALATPDQSVAIKNQILGRIHADTFTEGFFELAWLCGLLSPSYPTVQALFLKCTVCLFPAFTFAMIVALCDGYLEVAREITVSQRRFFTLMLRLPMDLQSLVSLRLWGHASTVIQSNKFTKALLTII